MTTKDALVEDAGVVNHFIWKDAETSTVLKTMDSTEYLCHIDLQTEFDLMPFQILRIFSYKDNSKVSYLFLLTV